MRLVRMTRPIVWASVGAAAAYFGDPDRGRGRRARTKDQVAAALRRSQRRMDRKRRYLEHKAEGIAARAAGVGAREAPTEDTVIADKVRSEVMGGARFRDYQVNVDVVDGVATLRGALPDRDTITALEQDVRKVDGVREVQNLLHVPGTPAPNKEPSLGAGAP